jgi:hypothetical protein
MTLFVAGGRISRPQLADGTASSAIIGDDGESAYGAITP